MYFITLVISFLPSCTQHHLLLLLVLHLRMDASECTYGPFIFQTFSPGDNAEPHTGGCGRLLDSPVVCGASVPVVGTYVLTHSMFASASPDEQTQVTSCSYF